jgi:DNA-binding IclR family transcriptional regulator
LVHFYQHIHQTGRIALKEKLTKKNQSVEKVLQIIEIMAQARSPMRLADISEKLDLPASTVLRFVNTLMAYGYVNQDPETMKYRLSIKFCQIGDLVNAQFSIRDTVRPYLIDLTEKCQESACLAIEDNMTVIYIDTVDGPDNLLRTTQRIGKAAPLHATGVGKLLLLNYTLDKLDRLIREKGLSALTCKTITTREGLLEELDKIRQQGYSLDDEECEIGAKCIAAPIRDYTGKVVACVSVSGPTSRMNDEKMESVKAVLLSATRRISEKLGSK